MKFVVVIVALTLLGFASARPKSCWRVGYCEADGLEYAVPGRAPQCWKMGHCAYNGQWYAGHDLDLAPADQRPTTLGDLFKGKRSAGDELKELVISSQQKNMLNTMMVNAQTAFSQAQQGTVKFFNAALNSQIGLARETFLKGLEQLQTAADGYMDQGVDALKKYLPGLQGVVASRVDSVSNALDKYVADNKGKMDEVRQILLENAQQTLANLKGKLASTKSTADVTSIVNAIDAVENQVINV